jgi:hypothetical protein
VHLLVRAAEALGQALHDNRGRGHRGAMMAAVQPPLAA